MSSTVAYDEIRLISQLKIGSEAALAGIIKKYTPYVGAIVSNVSGGFLSRQDEEEIISDTFFALWNNADKLRPGKLKAYLGTIARNKAKSALRHMGHELSLEEDILTLTADGPEQELTAVEESRLVREAIDAMPEPDRTIFIHRYWLCQNAPTIAQLLDMNAHTVQTKLTRGRERLRLALEEGGYTLG